MEEQSLLDADLRGMQVGKGLSAEKLSLSPACGFLVVYAASEALVPLGGAVVAAYRNSCPSGESFRSGCYGTFDFSKKYC